MLLDKEETGTPNVSTLTEVNEQKSITKKVRAHMTNLISRKELLQNNKPVFSQSSNVTNTIPMSPTTPVRRSSRLFSNSYSVKENNKSPNRGKFAAPKSPSRKSKQRITKCNFNDLNNCMDLNAKNKLKKEKTETVTSIDNKNSAITNNNSGANNQQITVMQIQKQSAEGLMYLFKDLAQAYLYLSQFECKKAIDEFKALPSHQFETAWVYSMLGLAYFEMASYEKSAKYFSKVRSIESFRIKYMDIYSTALWHLQKEVALSALAQDLIELNKNSPITWVVSGNCFSLHKEHDTAIKFLHRAVQVDRDYPYAYTLLGHEYITTEELDKAKSCYQSAIRLDPRHYNAWFGMGTIYSKQEIYELAESSYIKALSINSNNAVIMCHIGVVQHALKKTNSALNTLNKAISSNPTNALCKFHRGSIYFAVGRHAEALRELEKLKEIVPKESLVYYLLGKVHKKLGNTHLALMHFSRATELDPKGASSQIKEAFDPGIGRSIEESDSIESSTYPAEQLQRLSEPFNEDSDDSL